MQPQTAKRICLHLCSDGNSNLSLFIPGCISAMQEQVTTNFTQAIHRHSGMGTQYFLEGWIHMEIQGIDRYFSSLFPTQKETSTEDKLQQKASQVAIIVSAPE